MFRLKSTWLDINTVYVYSYGLELEQIKGTISSETFKEPTQREDSKKVIKKLFEERYQTGKNKWFFSKLRF